METPRNRDQSLELFGIEPIPARANRLHTLAKRLGYSLRTVTNRAGAVAYLKQNSPRVIIVSDSLPDAMGYDVVREIRNANFRVPIVITSTSDEKVDRFLAAEVGADTFVRLEDKESDLKFLEVAVVEAIAKSESLQIAPRHLIFRDMEIDLDSRKVFKKGKEETLTETEFSVLAFMAVNAGKFLSREKILMAVWGFTHQIDTRTIDVHVFNLRRKTEPSPAKPRYVGTVNGIGYRFNNLTLITDPSADNVEAELVV
jgi:two-component system KDP operon response regulator KdpE